MEIRGIGIDGIEVDRVRSAVERWGQPLITRIFTREEVRRSGPEAMRAMRLAARFAAKEAVMKALGLGWRTMGWHEIQILNDDLGRPLVDLRGRTAQVAALQGVRTIHVTLSHSLDLALASAVAIGIGWPA